MPFRPTRIPPSLRPLVGPVAPLALILALAWPAPALATFHLNEVTKVMAGYEGDANVQAVELQMLFNGENLVNGATLNVYDAAGTFVGALGTFGADLSATNAIAGRKILLATMEFKQKFGITPDLQIAAGILPTTGQIAFEKAGCVVDAVAYGAVTGFKVGTTPAPPLPTAAAAILIRTSGAGSFPSCPLGTDSGRDFALTTASPSNPVAFSNNSGTTVTVTSTVTGVETTAASVRFRIAPNPVRTAATIVAPAARRLAIFDVRGRLVREVAPASGGTAPMAVRWAGDDRDGRPVPSGIYFLRYDGDDGPLVRRFAVIR